MYGSTISKVLTSDSWCKDIFKGLICKDVLPKFKRVETFPMLYIYNTASSDESGEHWLAIYFTSSDKVEFFDPLSQSVSSYGLVKYFKTIGIKKLDYNTQPVQHFTSTTCGYHVLYFSLLRCRGFQFDFIMKKGYSDDLYNNDIYIPQIIRERCGIK